MDFIGAQTFQRKIQDRSTVWPDPSSDAEGAGTRLMKTLMMITLPAVIPSSVTKKASTCRCSGDIGAENQQECQEQANG